MPTTNSYSNNRDRARPLRAEANSSLVSLSFANTRSARLLCARALAKAASTAARASGRAGGVCFASPCRSWADSTPTHRSANAGNDLVMVMDTSGPTSYGGRRPPARPTSAA